MKDGGTELFSHTPLHHNVDDLIVESDGGIKGFPENFAMQNDKLFDISLRICALNVAS